LVLDVGVVDVEGRFSFGIKAPEVSGSGSTPVVRRKISLSRVT